MKKGSIKINIIYQMLYEALVLLLPLITSPYVSRVLGAECLGVYSYTYSIAYYFGIFAMLGVKNYGNREIAKCRDDKEQLNKNFINIYCVQIMMSVVVFILYMSFIFVLGAKYKIYLLIQLLYLFSCFIDINWLYFGLEKFKLTVTRNTIIKVLTFLLIFICIKNESDLYKYCLIMSLGSILSQIIIWAYLPKNISFQKPEISEIKKHIKPMFILFIPVLAVSIYNIMDKIMLGSISEKTELGFYENSEKIIFCVRTVITAFGTVMMPRMSKLAAEGNKKQSEKYLNLSIEFVMLIAFAFSFGIASVANLFAPIFWGEKFYKCSDLLIGLSITIPFTSFANVIRTQYLIPKNKDKEYIISVVLGAIVNAIFNAILIPKYNAIGAVIGTILAEITVCLVQCYFVKNELNLIKLIKRSIPFLLFGITMFISVCVLSNILNFSLLSLLIKIVCGGLVYMILSFIYFIYTKNEVLLRTISVFNAKFKNIAK